MADPLVYLRNGEEIYRRSFAIIRAEGKLGRFTPDEEPVAVRMIHACGMIDIADALRFSPGIARRARRALETGAPVLCDSRMVANGVTRARLPADNAVLCALDDPRVPALAIEMETTRTAAGMDLLKDRFGGAIIAIGNAPTALFRLLELIDAGAPMPAAVIGLPVGFVGAAESKEALAARKDVPFIVLEGRKGGSAIAAAAINALASERE